MYICIYIHIVITCNIMYTCVYIYIYIYTHIGCEDRFEQYNHIIYGRFTIFVIYYLGNTIHRLNEYYLPAYCCVCGLSNSL